ncbi:MAG: hypothetical protein JW755_02355 [Candidatus Aminicenantes bacterium]|nr:hypothetical protein [Candidatus Aminicenantes bacterium]
MKIKNLLFFLLACAIVITALSETATAWQEQQPTQQQSVVIIPPEVKTVLEQGMESREARLDIPFNLVEHLYLPAAQNLHNIFIFKVKNADLGYAPLTPAVETEEKKEETQSSFEEVPTLLQARSHMFMLFTQLDGTYSKEVYVPVRVQIEGGSYDPEAVDMYSVGYPLPAGNYLLSIAIASQKLENIGTQYFEFTIPDPLSYTSELGTTPIFFVKSVDRMPSAEVRTEIHKDYFVYSILKMVPNLDRVFTAGDNLDVFFVIFGSQPDETQKYDIEIAYEVVQGEEKMIRYAPQKYESPLISQPLPLTRTVIVKTTDEEGNTTEKKETRDLEPGKYTFSVDIKDNISGKKLIKTIEVEVK